MAIRMKGRSVNTVHGRAFAWYVHRETHVRIASEDKQTRRGLLLARRAAVSGQWPGVPRRLAARATAGPAAPACLPLSESGGVGAAGHRLGAVLRPAAAG